MTQVGKLVIDLQAQLDKFNSGMNQAKTKVKNFGNNISSTGRNIAVTGGIITGVFGGIAKKAITTFMGVNQQLVETKSIIGPTGATFKELDSIVTELGITTKFTQKQLADGLRQIASAGIKEEEQMESVLASASDLASAIGTDLNTAIGHTIGMTEAFGDELGGTTGAVDLMANAVSSARLESDDLGQILKYATGISRGFGQDIEDTVAVIAGFTQITGDASQGSIYFRQALSQLTKQTDKQKRVLAELGLTYEEVNPETNSMIDIIKRLDGANISGARSTALLGARASTLLQVSKEALPVIDRVRASLDEQGSAARMAEDNLDSLKGSWDLLTSSFELMWKVLGGALAPVFKKFFEDLKIYIDVISQAIVKHGELIAQLIVLGIKIGLVMTAVGTGLILIGKLITLFSMLLTPIGLATMALGGLYLAFKDSFENIVGLGEALHDYLFGLGGEIFEIFATIKKAIMHPFQADEIIGTFVRESMERINALEANIGEKAGAIGESFAGTQQKFIEMGGQAYETVENVKTVMDDLKSKIAEGGNTVKAKLEKPIKEIPKEMGKTKSKFQKECEQINKTWSKSGKNFSTVYNSMFSGFNDGMTKGVGETFDKAILSMGTNWDNFDETIKDSLSGIGDAIRNAMVTATAEWVAGAATSAMASVAAWVFKVVPWPFNLAVVGGAVAGVASFFHNLKYLAEGGMTTGPMMAMVGDNPSGKELIIPLEKLGGLMSGAGGGDSYTVIQHNDFEKLQPVGADETFKQLTEATKDGMYEAIEFGKKLKEKQDLFSEES